LTWFKDEIVLPAANRYTTDYDLSTNIASLKIDNAQMNDLGNYVVLAENDAGRDQTFCSVYVQDTPNVDETPLVNPEAFKFLENVPPKVNESEPEDNINMEPPKVVIPLQNLQLKEGETVLLMCKITGRPKPKVS
jgi:tRNA A37 threonylcarbamoyladenosine modification protein TsaB